MNSAFWGAVTASLVIVAGQAAHAASEGSLYDDFVRDCAAHVGDAAAPLNAVSQQGWKPIPQQALQAKVPPISIPGFKTDWYHAYTSAQFGRSLALFAGRGEMFSGTGLPPLPATFCLVLQKPLDPTSLQRIGSWTNAPKVAGGPYTSAYLFRNTPAGREPENEVRLYQDFRSGIGRELIALSHPTEHASAIMIVAPIQTQ